MVTYLNPLIICASDKKLVKDVISKGLSTESWPIVYQDTPDDALKIYQENMVSVIIDPLYNTACPSCGKLDDWIHKNTKCTCGFYPTRGKNIYIDWPKAKRKTMVILCSQAPKSALAVLKSKDYWAVKLRRENTYMDLPRIIKKNLKTMSQYYRL